MATINLLNELIATFSDMSIIVYFLLLIGLVLIVCEILQPSKGIMIIFGTMSLIAAVVTRAFQGGSFANIFFMIFLIALLISSFYLLVVANYRNAWIRRSMLLPKQSINPSERDSGFENIIDLCGLTTTKLTPFGQANIEDTIFYVASNSGHIESGKKIKVVGVEGVKILVECVEICNDLV